MKVNSTASAPVSSGSARPWKVLLPKCTLHYKVLSMTPPADVPALARAQRATVATRERTLLCPSLVPATLGLALSLAVSADALFRDGLGGAAFPVWVAHDRREPGWARLARRSRRLARSSRVARRRDLLLDRTRLAGLGAAPGVRFPRHRRLVADGGGRAQLAAACALRTAHPSHRARRRPCRAHRHRRLPGSRVSGRRGTLRQRTMDPRIPARNSNRSRRRHARRRLSDRSSATRIRSLRATWRCRTSTPPRSCDTRSSSRLSRGPSAVGRAEHWSAHPTRRTALARSRFSSAASRSRRRSSRSSCCSARSSSRSSDGSSVAKPICERGLGSPQPPTRARGSSKWCGWLRSSFRFSSPHARRCATDGRSHARTRCSLCRSSRCSAQSSSRRHCGCDSMSSTTGSPPSGCTRWCSWHGSRSCSCGFR